MKRALALLVATATTTARLFQANTDNVVFPDLDCSSFTFTGSCQCNTPLKGGSLHISEGHIQGTSTLACPGCAAAGLTASFDSKTGLMKLTGDATIAKYIEAIKTVTFRTSQASTDYRVGYNLGQGVYSAATGHFYDFHHYPVPCRDNHCHWENAQEDCAKESNDLLGLIGYLVTITSHEEDKFAADTLHAEGWIGATDVGEEGTWRWATGPEGMMGPDACAAYDTSVTGARRSSCNIYPLKRTANGCTGPECNKGLIIGRGKTWNYQKINFDNWAYNEPNNYDQPCPGDCDTTQEDYAHFLSNGEWNDYPYTHNYIEGYVCEWGGIGDLCIAEGDLHKSVPFVQGCSRYKDETECTDEQPGECYWSGGSCFKHVECTCSHDCSNC